MKKRYIIMPTSLLVLIIFTIFLLNDSLSPYREARADAFTHAETYTPLKETNNYYHYNGNQGPYLTVTGYDEKGKFIVAIIEQNTGHIDLYGAEQVISEERAAQLFQEEMPGNEIKEIRIGKESGQSIWEISYKTAENRMGYYYLSLENGTWLKTVDNL
ncbi:MAG: DUF5590 domain-containing protein [Atopococcus tabaci]|uniref:DUF5590 domain-containing protein n=1 Tax=Atopococcus tabaci TaxID=269774 RepID=A0AA43RJW3_9LACT|nr:DUF5590 domain-containing protein [Atopococcus tabaci]